MWKLVCATVLLLVTSSLLEGQDTEIRYRQVVASSQQYNTCAVTATPKELKARLTEFGWSDKSNDFPNIDWSNKIAVVVTARDRSAQPKTVFPPTSDGNVRILLQADASRQNSGVLVLELDKNQKTKTCTVEYPVLPQSEDNPSRTHGRSETTERQP